MDEEGVLGNLPRSRPGTRSERRTKGGGTRPGKTAEQAAERAERSGRPAARAPRGAAPRRPQGAASPGAGRPRRPADDPVRDAARAVAKLAGTSLLVTAGIAQEVLRRLPRW